MRSGIVPFLVVIAGLGMMPTVLADDATPHTSATSKPADPDRWRFTVAPYLWGASLDGDVRIGRIEQDVDLNFIDVLKDFSFDGMVYAEARRDRYGVFTNMFFVPHQGLFQRDRRYRRQERHGAGGAGRIISRRRMGQWGEGR